MLEIAEAMEKPESEPVRYAVDDGVATITIDRPERKNALSVDAMNGLTDAWARVEADRSARVVILTSSDCGVFPRASTSSRPPKSGRATASIS